MHKVCACTWVPLETAVSYIFLFSISTKYLLNLAITVYLRLWWGSVVIVLTHQAKSSDTD